jgi:hypothetical protein
VRWLRQQASSAPEPHPWFCGHSALAAGASGCYNREAPLEVLPMILLLSGALIAALGLYSGLVLVLAPLNLVTWVASPVLWVFFPLFSLVGYAMVVVAARRTQIRAFTVLVSGLLLLLALGSAAGLVLSAASVLEGVDDMLSLWYVLCVAGLIGGIGAAAFGRPAAVTP